MRRTRLPPRDGERQLVFLSALCLALLAVSYCFQHGWILLYGDAVAHINIARRVFDSRTPGLLQLGTVWLPLPHLVMIPFLTFNDAWRSGLGGSIPSLIAYLAGALGVLRLMRHSLRLIAEPDAASHITTWLAAAIYAANPNLLYLQATAMTEPLYIAFFIWVVVHFSEFAAQGASPPADDTNSANSSLTKCALCLMAAELTRYDGWFAGVVTVALVTILFIRGCRPSSTRPSRSFRQLRNFLLIAGAAPILWLAYNAIVYRNPLEFANGPYSARAIEQKTAHPGFPPHPGDHNLLAAGQYFLKSAQSNLVEGGFGHLWLFLAIAGTLAILLKYRRLSPLLLLWIPLPFYILSVAYSGVPVFVPAWWPFSYYNVRYGIQMLPMAAVFVPLAVYSLVKLVPSTSARAVFALGALALVAGSYFSVLRAHPVCFREAWVNSRTRLALENELASNLRKLPPDSTLLMYLGEHVGALQQAGIPLKRVINEGNHRTWKQPLDPDGLWERTLASPASFADYAIGIGDDPVSRSAREHRLASLVIIDTTGQPRATIYFAHAPSPGNLPR